MNLNENQSNVSMNAECSLLGSIILGGGKQLLAAEEIGLKAEMFSTETYQKIFAAMQSVYERTRGIDILVLVKELEPIDNIGEIRNTVIQMAEVTPSGTNAAVYAGYVIEEWKCRKLAALLNDARMYGIHDSGQTFAEFRALQESLDNGTSCGMVITPASGTKKFAKRLRDGFEGKIKSISTGYERLDATISGGFHGGAVYVLAGRTGEGKTTFGIQIANNVAMNGIPVLYVSLEMSSEMINAKRISRYVGRSANDILFGSGDEDVRRNLTDKEKERAIEMAEVHLPNLPWYSNVSMGIKVSDIGQMARSIEGLGLIVIDHIGLLDANTEKDTSRTNEMTKITRDLKILAISLDVPILEMCQFNREATKSDKDGKPMRKPTMADLKDSSSIEQDADVVWLLERVFYGKNRNACDVIKIKATKNRYGRVGGFSFFAADLAIDKIEEISKERAEEIERAPDEVGIYG